GQGGCRTSGRRPSTGRGASRPAPPGSRPLERVGNTSLSGDPGTSHGKNDCSTRGNIGDAWSSAGILQRQPPLLVRLGATSCWQPSRGPGKLATSADRIGNCPQTTTGKFWPDR